MGRPRPALARGRCPSGLRRSAGRLAWRGPGGPGGPEGQEEMETGKGCFSKGLGFGNGSISLLLLADNYI